MRRWRARLGLGAIGAVLALGSALAVAPALAGPAAGLVPADTSTLQVWPSAVQVSQATTLLTGVTLGPGQQVGITYATATATVTAPGTAGLTTTAASRGPMSDWLPILLVVAGLVLAAAAAGLLAFRPLRRSGHPVPEGNVRAVPHSGPPASVTARDTGSRPALTVRIEPQAGATATTIEERHP